MVLSQVWFFWSGRSPEDLMAAKLIGHFIQFGNLCHALLQEWLSIELQFS